jgi:hypothetical protein
VSGNELLGRCWSLQLEVATAGGWVAAQASPLPGRLPDQASLSLHLPLPRLAPRDTPVRLQVRLLFHGAAAAGLAPSQPVATRRLSLLELVQRVQTGGSGPSPVLQGAGGRAAFLASLGPGAPEEKAAWAAELGREAVAGSGLALLVEAQEAAAGQRTALTLDFFGRRLAVEVDPAGPDRALWSWRAGEPGLLGALRADLEARGLLAP